MIPNDTDEKNKDDAQSLGSGMSLGVYSSKLKAQPGDAF